MTSWRPIWQVEIDGVSYTNAILANLAISSGRRNIYEQAAAGYVNLELLDVNQAIIPVAINSTISVSIKDMSGTFVPIFGGNVVDIGIAVRDIGSTMFTQTYAITALGALARLPKALTLGVLASDFEGDQIFEILRDVLFAQWQQVPGALTWATYDPTLTWANAGNNGIGTIDRPGNYLLAARVANRTDVYSLVSALATSGVGYIYEDAQGRISYADSTHRTNYLQANGYVDIDANYARGKNLQIQTRVGDVRNRVAIKYGADSSSEESSQDDASIALYGELAQVIGTTLANAADATEQAEFYLSLRANPEAIFSEITFDLTNPEIPSTQRDRLLNIFMGEAISLTNLPLNMSSGNFQGFVEGWSFEASYNQLSLTLLLSPLAYSLQAMRWNDVPLTETFASVSPTLDWANATIIA
jgi:hypothetical protein